MRLNLTDTDLAMLEGCEGTARQMAMRVIVRMAELAGASRLINIESAHIDACGYPGNGVISLVERLAEHGGIVKVPTSLNAVAKASLTERLLHALIRMGAEPTLTCAPYLLKDTPKYGEQIAWGESNAVVYANSVIGARTNRYGDGMDICAALTGRVPYTGLHLAENRKGTILVRLPNITLNPLLYAVLGYAIGARVSRGVPIIEGIQRRPTNDELKAFGAAIASSGSIALFHIIGVTPEVPNKEEVLANSNLPVWHMTLAEIEQAYLELTEQQHGPIDAVILGSPHLSLNELSELTSYTKGLHCHKRVQVLITTSRYIYQQAEKMGMIAELERFGATCLTDTCPCFIDVPIIKSNVQVILTSSAKYAHYGPGLLNKNVILTSLKECIVSSTTGRFRAKSALWL